MCCVTEGKLLFELMQKTLERARSKLEELRAIEESDDIPPSTEDIVTYNVSVAACQ